MMNTCMVTNNRSELKLIDAYGTTYRKYRSGNGEYVLTVSFGLGKDTLQKLGIEDWKECDTVAHLIRKDWRTGRTVKEETKGLKCEGDHWADTMKSMRENVRNLFEGVTLNLEWNMELTKYRDWNGLDVFASDGAMEKEHGWEIRVIVGFGVVNDTSVEIQVHTPASFGTCNRWMKVDGTRFFWDSSENMSRDEKMWYVRKWLQDRNYHLLESDDERYSWKKVFVEKKELPGGDERYYNWENTVMLDVTYGYVKGDLCGIHCKYLTDTVAKLYMEDEDGEWNCVEEAGINTFGEDFEWEDLNWDEVWARLEEGVRSEWGIVMRDDWYNI